MKNTNISYGKVYTDDSGKHMPDIFPDHEPYNISYKTLWANVVDGFLTIGNSDVILTAVQGNIRVIIANNESGSYRFEQYYLSELDGKVFKVPTNTTFAIHNLDESKSAYIMGTYVDKLNVTFTSNNIFHWRKKRP